MKIKRLMTKFLPILKNWGAEGKDAISLAEELAQSISQQDPGEGQKKSKIAVLKRTAGLDKCDKPTKNYYVYIAGNGNKDSTAIQELADLGLITTSPKVPHSNLTVYTLTDTGCKALGFSGIAALESSYTVGGLRSV